MHDTFAPVESASIDANRLPWLANEYLSSLRGKITEQSREKYEQRIRHFLRWLPAHPLTERNMADFAVYLAKSHLKIQTQADVIERVGQMFRWAHRTGIAKQDYSIWLPIINAPITVFNPVSDADVLALLAACNKMRYAMRDQAMISIMAGAGLRLNEAISTNTTDLSFDADNTGSVVVRSGKNSKSRVVGFPAHFGEHVRRWVDALDTPGPVVTSQKGDRISADGAYTEFKAIARHANLDVSCHDMRRYFATKWIIANPGRLLELQKQMGHSDPATTSAYIWLTPEYMKSISRSAR